MVMEQVLNMLTFHGPKLMFQGLPTTAQTPQSKIVPRLPLRLELGWMCVRGPEGVCGGLAKQSLDFAL